MHFCPDAPPSDRALSCRTLAWRRWSLLPRPRKFTSNARKPSRIVQSSRKSPQVVASSAACGSSGICRQCALIPPVAGPFMRVILRRGGCRRGPVGVAVADGGGNDRRVLTPNAALPG